MKKRILLAMALAVPFASEAETPSLTELWNIVQAQQQQIKALQDKLNTAQAQLSVAESKLETTTTQIAETDAKVEATADALEEGAVESPKSIRSTWADRTQVGGYSELHYNNLDDDAITDGDADDLNRVDFHRFVIYLSHQFNDRIRFFSELEVEHALAGEGLPGEVELEQAWVEIDLTSRHHLRAGLDLVPIGILNPTHEPNTFYGVERNPIETEIIPSTWWEAGVGTHGELGRGFSYDAVVHSGLKMPIAGGSRFRPRSGRLKVANADNQDVAFTGRLKYTAIPGLELATSLHYERDYTGAADRPEADAFLVETHLDWKHRSGLALRALYARWNLEDDRVNGLIPESVDADVLQGWYVEPAYRFMLPMAVLGEAGIFARYNQWDERNQLTGAAFRYVRYERSNVGVNYWPHPNVVFKFDMQWDSADEPTAIELDGFNLGVGLQF